MNTRARRKWESQIKEVGCLTDNNHWQGRSGNHKSISGLGAYWTHTNHRVYEFVDEKTKGKDEGQPDRHVLPQPFVDPSCDNEIVTDSATRIRLETINYVVLGRYMQRCCRCKITGTLGQGECKSTLCPSDDLHLCKLRSQGKLNYLISTNKEIKRLYNKSEKFRHSTLARHSSPSNAYFVYSCIFFLRKGKLIASVPTDKV